MKRAGVPVLNSANRLSGYDAGLDAAMIDHRLLLDKARDAVTIIDRPNVTFAREFHSPEMLVFTDWDSGLTMEVGVALIIDSPPAVANIFLHHIQRHVSRGLFR